MTTKGGHLRVGFVQPCSLSDVQWFKPLAPGYLSAWLTREYGNAIEMLPVRSEADFRGLDVLAISSTSQDFAHAIQAAELAKQLAPRIITVIGGHHPTMLPQTAGQRFDILVRGEGEETFGELMGAILREGGLPDEDILATIRGVGFSDGGRVVTTERRPLITPLDRIPAPVRWETEHPYLFTSRGCPFRCSFCSSTAFWERVRFHSPERVVEEVAQIAALGAQQINFQDDLATADRKRFRRIVELLEERDLAKSVGYAFSVRANLVDEGLCEILERLKINSVCFGAESGTDRILALANKRLTTATNQHALDTLHAHGITCTVSAIVGWPTETEQEVRATYDFLRRNVEAGKLSPASVVNVLSPMPGSKVWDEWVARERVDLQHFDWNRLGLYANWRHSRLGSFDAWRAARQQNNTVYLGTLEYERLMDVMAEYEGGTKASERPGGRCIVFPDSMLAHVYLDGRKGIEIGGSAHNPFHIAGCRNVDVTDSMDTIFKAEERSMCGSAAKVDIVAPADKLPMPDESEDYVLSSHVLEHVWDVFGCLKEWNRVLQPGGIVFCIVPKRDALREDAGRPLTTVGELIDRHENHTRPGPEAVPWGHHSVFTLESLEAVVDHARSAYGLPWEWCEKLPSDDKVGNGSSVVLQKRR